jgi:hypothetical protein
VAALSDLAQAEPCDSNQPDTIPDGNCSPKLVTYTGTEPDSGVAWDGTRIAAGSWGGWIYLFDTSNGWELSSVAHLHWDGSSGGETTHRAVADGVALVAHPAIGLRIVEVSNVAGPTEVGAYTPSDGFSVDVSDPWTPVEGWSWSKADCWYSRLAACGGRVREEFPIDQSIPS